MTNAEAWFNKSLRPRKPEGSLGRTAQDGHLDSYTAPELYIYTQYLLSAALAMHTILSVMTILHSLATTTATAAAATTATTTTILLLLLLPLLLSHLREL